MFCRLSKHFARTEKHQRDEARSHRRPSKSPSPRNRRRPSKSPEPKKRRKFRESSKSPENTSSSGKHKKYHVGIAHIFLIYDECQPQSAKVLALFFPSIDMFFDNYKEIMLFTEKSRKILKNCILFRAEF